MHAKYLEKLSISKKSISMEIERMFCSDYVVYKVSHETNRESLHACIRAVFFLNAFN